MPSISYNSTFSAFKCDVFNSYKKALGTGEIKLNNMSTNISAIVTDVKFVPENSAISANVDLRLKDLDNKSFHNTNLVLENVQINSYDKDTSLSSDKTYEKLCNMPSSAKIFSKDYNNDSWVTHDLDWTYNANEDSTLSSYWETEYGFSTGFSEDEYYSYNLNLTYLDENVVCVSASDFIVNSGKGNKDTMNNGAAGLLLVYQDQTHKDKNAIPMAYLNFPKVFYSNYNYLEVDWNQDGVMKVE